MDYPDILLSAEELIVQMILEKKLRNDSKTGVWRNETDCSVPLAVLMSG